MRGIPVRIYSSHPVACDEYSRVLAADPDLRLVSNGEPFELAVLDSQTESIYSVLNFIQRKFPSARSLLISGTSDEDECYGWLLRGVWGLVASERYKEQLPRAVRQVAEGQLWFPANVVKRWMQTNAGHYASSTSHFSLTPREVEVLDLIRRRLCNKEVAGILRISERTVKFHLGNIFAKLHVNSRSALVGNLDQHPA